MKAGVRGIDRESINTPADLASGFQHWVPAGMLTAALHSTGTTRESGEANPAGHRWGPGGSSAGGRPGWAQSENVKYPLTAIKTPLPAQGQLPLLWPSDSGS